MQMQNNIIISEDKSKAIIERLVCQLIEVNNDFSNTAIIGLQPRGVLLAGMIKNILEK